MEEELKSNRSLRSCQEENRKLLYSYHNIEKKYSFPSVNPFDCAFMLLNQWWKQKVIFFLFLAVEIEVSTLLNELSKQMFLVSLLKKHVSWLVYIIDECLIFKHKYFWLCRSVAVGAKLSKFIHSFPVALPNLLKHLWIQSDSLKSLRALKNGTLVAVRV